MGYSQRPHQSSPSRVAFMKKTTLSQEMDGEEAELRVASLLQAMGFGLVDRNVKLLDSAGQAIGEIDSVFKCGRTLLIVEVGTGRSSISDKKKGFFDKWKDGPTLDTLIRLIDWEPRRTLRAYFDMRPRLLNPGKHDLNGTAGPGTGNRICYQEDFDGFAEDVRRGSMTKNDFLQGFD